MITPESHPQRLRVAHLNPNAPTTFHLRPDEGVREALAAELGLDALTRLDFRGTLRAHGTDSWLLTATLAARVLVQEHRLYPAVLRRFASGDRTPLVL